jgi:uncharacterized membrane protein YfcA
MDLLPASVSLLDAGILIGTAGFTSLLTGAMGIGGGVLLLAIMAGIVPAAALIPVHGLVQLGSNGNRAWMTRRHIDRGLLGRFALGALGGALLASLIVVQLPLQWIQFSVAAFILYLVWGPKPGRHSLGAGGQLLAGGFTTLVSMFVGATGPLVAGFLHRHGMDKLATTATFAACMSAQHLLKMAVFSAVGFAFWDWLPLVAAMILAGMAGTWLGLKLLDRMPAAQFKRIFAWVVTLMALRLLWQASGF